MVKGEEWERSERPVYNIKLCSIIRIFLNKTNLIHFTHKISIQNNVMILYLNAIYADIEIYIMN